MWRFRSTWPQRAWTRSRGVAAERPPSRTFEAHSVTVALERRSGVQAAFPAQCDCQAAGCTPASPQTSNCRRTGLCLLGCNRLLLEELRIAEVARLGRGPETVLYRQRGPSLDRFATERDGPVVAFTTKCRLAGFVQQPRRRAALRTNRVAPRRHSAARHGKRKRSPPPTRQSLLAHRSALLRVPARVNPTALDLVRCSAAAARPNRV